MVKNGNLAMWFFFSFATQGFTNRNSRLGHSCCHAHYLSHKAVCGQNKGRCVECVSWAGEGRCLRADRVSCRRSRAEPRAGTGSPEQLRPPRGTACSDGSGPAPAGLELSQTPCPHLVGKKNRHCRHRDSLLRGSKAPSRSGPTAPELEAALKIILQNCCLFTPTRSILTHY